MDQAHKAKVRALIDRIEDTEQRLDFVKQQYLEFSGWKKTCDAPGSYWMYTKEIKGKQYMCFTDQAVSIQQCQHSMENMGSDDDSQS